LQGAEISALANVARSGCFRLDLLGGFRYLQLNESLNVTQDFVAGDFSEEDTWDDAFRTRNNFYGGQIGARAEYAYHRFFMNVTGKVALGVTNQQVALDGGLTQAFLTNGTDNLGNPVQNVQVTHTPGGGLLELPATLTRNHFTVVPELGYNLGYQFTPYMRGAIGYTFVYWSSVVRPGDQVTGLPRATSFWAQGLNFSLGFNF
jgi:hypothetical protein